LEQLPNTHETEKLIKVFNLTHFYTKKYRKFGEKNESSVIIRFVAKTSDIRNFCQNIKSDVET